MSILFLLNLNVLYLVSLMDFSSKFVVVENLLLDKGVRAKILFLFAGQGCIASSVIEVLILIFVESLRLFLRGSFVKVINVINVIAVVVVHVIYIVTRSASLNLTLANDSCFVILFNSIVVVVLIIVDVFFFEVVYIVSFIVFYIIFNFIFILIFIFVFVCCKFKPDVISLLPLVLAASINIMFILIIDLIIIVVNLIVDIFAYDLYLLYCVADFLRFGFCIFLDRGLLRLTGF